MELYIYYSIRILEYWNSRTVGENGSGYHNVVSKLTARWRQRWR